MKTTNDVLNPEAPIVKNGRRANCFSYQELLIVVR